MGWSDGLLVGVAEYLAAGGVGTWNPSGTYAAGQTGIFLAVVPVAPDRSITLTEYGPLDQDGIGDVTQGLQIRCRGTKDPRVVMGIRDGIRDVLDGLAHIDLGGVTVSQIFHLSGVALGQDSGDRHERSDNYAIQARRTTALRND